VVKPLEIARSSSPRRAGSAISSIAAIPLAADREGVDPLAARRHGSTPPAAHAVPGPRVWRLAPRPGELADLGGSADLLRGRRSAPPSGRRLSTTSGSSRARQALELAVAGRRRGKAATSSSCRSRSVSRLRVLAPDAGGRRAASRAGVSPGALRPTIGAISSNRTPNMSVQHERDPLRGREACRGRSRARSPIDSASSASCSGSEPLAAGSGNVGSERLLRPASAAPWEDVQATPARAPW